MRRSAICAVEVMASASSRMMSLKEARELAEGVELEKGAVENICLVPACVRVALLSASVGLSRERERKGLEAGGRTDWQMSLSALVQRQCRGHHWHSVRAPSGACSLGRRFFVPELES